MVLPRPLLLFLQDCSLVRAGFVNLCALVGQIVHFAQVARDPDVG